MTNPAKILIVNDSLEINELLKARLGSAGFLLDIAETGEEGLEKARQGSYQFILLDYMLPGLDGGQICRILKSEDKTKNIPTVIFSALAEQVLAIKAKDCGADGYFTSLMAGRKLAEQIKDFISGREGTIGQPATGQAPQALPEGAANEGEQFLDLAVHDLKEPIRIISSFARILDESLKDKLDETQKEYFQFIIDGAERMQKMLDGLALYVQIGLAGRSSEAVDLNQVLIGLEQGPLADRLKTSRGRLIRPEPLAKVAADPFLMTQLFKNILDNALKFQRDGLPPEVTIKTQTEGPDWIRVEIADNGLGIADQDQARIFELFQKLNPPAKYPGAGLGLAIAKKIVELFGGRIGVDSQLGKGSTFWFNIPSQRSKR